MGYLNSIKAGALETWKVYKILPSVVGAQGALESGWGTSRLAKPPYNNQFGIKPGNDWTGKTITMPTREYVNGAWKTVNEPFRWYDDPGESIRDHGAFFTSTEWRRNNYKAVVGETDYKKACWALQNAPAPYATDPGYAQKLINLIETHNLQAWDREAMAGNSNTVATQTQQTVVSKIVGRELSSAGRTYVKDLNVTMIGDSLGVGTKPHFESLVPKANYDVLGSRQITHATNSLNGTYILQQLKNAGNLKEYVVVILGTNRGVTEQEINNFVNIAGSDRKVIFVDTASEVGHSNTVSVHYENSAKRLSNVYYANWKSTAIPLRPQYYSRDGANGEYIHMTPTGYRKHAEFIAQALYEVATTNFTDRAAEATKTEFYDIKDLELNEDGLITYDVLESNSDGTSTKKKATKQTNIKGLYSPYGDSSIYNPKANQRYGFGSSVNNSNWRESYFEDNEIEDSVRLLELASAELIERQEPEMIYTVNLLEIPVELSIGDTGIFVDHEFSPPLYLQARVLSLTTSETNPSLNEATIGNVTELAPQDKSALMALRAELQETRKDLEGNWIGSISTNMTVVSTNGYVLGDRTRETSLVARVLKGKEDITNQYDKFTWERISEDEAKDSVYNDSLANSVQSSVLTVYEADIIGNQSKFVARAFNAKNELVSHQEIVLKRVETAIWVDTDTPPAYATDGSTWVNQDGEQYVKVDGEWEKRVDQQQISQVTIEVNNAMAEAEQAKEDAVQAREDAIAEAEAKVQAKDAEYKLIFEEYDSTVESIEADAQTAKTKAEQALTDAGISTDLAQTAKDLATTAQSNASTAISNANQAISDASVAINLATQATSDVNTISLDVDDLAGQVSLKANQTVVDQLSGTVNNHTADISANAQAIQARLTSTQVSDLVDGKGLAKVTYVDNQITATANGINVNLTKVEGKIDGLEVGGRNLVLNTKGKLYRTWSSGATLSEVDGATRLTWAGTSQTSMGEKLSVPLIIGETYTLSFKARGTLGTPYLEIYILATSGGNLSISHTLSDKILTNEFKKYTATFKFTGNPSDRLFIGGRGPAGTWLEVKDGTVKLEKGNIATDWTPAPEDTLMQNDFNVFRNSYQSTVDSINTELSKTAKKTDLNGMVTESILTTKQFVTQGAINTTLSNYLKTTDLNGKLKETVAYQGIKETTDRYTRVIGSTDEESRTKIAQIAMTDSLFQTTVRDSVDIGGSNIVPNTDLSIAGNINKASYWRAGTVVQRHLPPDYPEYFIYAGTDNQEIEYVVGFEFGKYDDGFSIIKDQVYTLSFLALVSTELQSPPNYVFVMRSSGANQYLSPVLVDVKRTQVGVAYTSMSVYKYEYTFKANWSDANAWLLIASKTIRANPDQWIRVAQIQLEKGNVASDWSPSPLDKANQSQVTQLAGSWALTLKSGNDIKTQINASTDSIRLASKFIHLSGTSLIDNATIKSAHIDSLNANKIIGNTADFNTIRTGVLTADAVTSTHIKADTALFDTLFSTTSATTRLVAQGAWIESANIKSLNADKITGNTAEFLSLSFESLNSNMHLSSGAIRIQNSSGDFVTMNAIPEFRSQDSAGTAAIMGKGRSHYYSGSQARFYIGSNLEGLAQYGVHIAKGQTWGIYRNSDSYGGTPAQYHKVVQGEHWRSITTKYWNDSTSVNVLMQLNGYNVNNYPVLQPGDVLLIKPAVPGNESGVERILTMGNSSDGSTRIYSHVYHVFNGGTSGTSDRRLKHDIEPTQVEALHHIESLTFKEFKWNRDNKYEPLGLIAQDSGIIRVPDEDMEGYDIQRAIMLGLKGVQELQEIVKEQAEEIKQLKEIINK